MNKENKSIELEIIEGEVITKERIVGIQRTVEKIAQEAEKKGYDEGYGKCLKESLNDMEVVRKQAQAEVIGGLLEHFSDHKEDTKTMGWVRLNIDNYAKSKGITLN